MASTRQRQEAHRAKLAKRAEATRRLAVDGALARRRRENAATVERLDDVEQRAEAADAEVDEVAGQLATRAEQVDQVLAATAQRLEAAEQRADMLTTAHNTAVMRLEAADAEIARLGQELAGVAERLPPREPPPPSEPPADQEARQPRD